MSRRAKADVNPDNADTRRLRTQLRRYHAQMSAADKERRAASRNVDRVIDELTGAGWTFQALGDLLGIDRRNAVTRAQRHRERLAGRTPADD